MILIIVMYLTNYSSLLPLSSVKWLVLVAVHITVIDLAKPTIQPCYCRIHLLNGILLDISKLRLTTETILVGLVWRGDRPKFHVCFALIRVIISSYITIIKVVVVIFVIIVSVA